MVIDGNVGSPDTREEIHTASPANQSVSRVIYERLEYNAWIHATSLPPVTAACIHESRMLPSIRRASSTNLVRVHALYSPDDERISLNDDLTTPHLPFKVVSSRREYFDPESKQHELGQGSCPPLPARSTTTVGGLKWCSLDVAGYSKRGRHLLTVLCLRQRNAKARKVSANTGENRDGVENKENSE